VSGAPDDVFDEVRTDAGVVRGRVRRAHARALCAGHFPGEPLLPGAYQAGLMATLTTRGLAAGCATPPILVEVAHCVFRARVSPEEDIEVVAWLEPDREGLVSAELWTHGRCAARARLRFA
jgi:hypothetical protein